MQRVTLKDLWSIAAYIVVMLGGVAVAFVGLIAGWDRALPMGGIAGGVWLGCQIMLWRHTVAIRETARHQELMHVLRGIYYRLEPHD